MAFESDRGSGWALGSARVDLNALLRSRQPLPEVKVLGMSEYHKMQKTKCRS